MVELLVETLFFSLTYKVFDHLLLFCSNRHFCCDHYPEHSFVPVLPLVLIMSLILLPLEKTIYLYILDKSSHPGNKISDLELKNNPFI